MQCYRLSGKEQIDENFLENTVITFINIFYQVTLFILKQLEETVWYIFRFWNLFIISDNWDNLSVY